MYVRLPAMLAMPSTPVILVRFTFIYMNAGKQVLISVQLQFCESQLSHFLRLIIIEIVQQNYSSVRSSVQFSSVRLLSNSHFPTGLHFIPKLDSVTILDWVGVVFSIQFSIRHRTLGCFD